MSTRVTLYYKADLPSKWRWPWKENTRKKKLTDEWNAISSIRKEHGVTSSRQSSDDTRFYVHLSFSHADAFKSAVEALKTPEGQQKWVAYTHTGRRRQSSGHNDVPATISSTMF